MKKALVLFECFILLIGTLLSVSATFSAVSWSVSYIPYFFFGVMQDCLSRHADIL